MTEELKKVIESFLRYSFSEIDYKYNQLTSSEKEFCTLEQWGQLMNWLNESSPDRKAS